MIEKAMIRQGDVLLVPVQDAMPITPRAKAAGKRSRHGRLVLAEGETSLHEHTLPETDAELVRQGERMLLSVFPEAGTVLAVTHTQTGQPLARHTPLRIGRGLYEVRTQRRAEITPAGMPQRWTRVSD
jgi:hypothetical protein